MSRRTRPVAAAAVALPVLLLAAGCSGAGGKSTSGGSSGGSSGGGSVNVLMVNNPQMLDLQKLTADNFTKQTGITVN